MRTHLNVDPLPLQEWVVLPDGSIRYRRWWSRIRWTLSNATCLSSRLRRSSAARVHPTHLHDTTTRSVNTSFSSACELFENVKSRNVDVFIKSANFYRCI